MKKYIYVKKSPANEKILSKFPSAGPGANVAGMRRLYWGVNALIVRSGNYIYHVDDQTFSRLMQD